MGRSSCFPKASVSCVILTVLVLSTAGCTGSGGQSELGEAYVAPATLNLRREITQKNGNVAVLKHGERVSVIDVRRRFVKIRTSKRQEGWVDSLQLLSTEQMEQTRKDARVAAALPSEGSATVFEALNIHIEPNRQSPAFAKIDEGTYVSVLGHHLSPKLSEAQRPANLIKERPAPERKKGRKGRTTRFRDLPEPPLPPKPPANWEELSAESFAQAESPAQAKKRKSEEAATLKAAEAQKPVAYEDWTLVRTKDNQSGWVLSRNLVMGIPDDVAQYAEGRRITSYFDLGTVNDEEKGVRHNWLWTTLSHQETFDFDAWRVFLWNRHRHRYETSFRQRDLEGYFPVRVDPADANAFGRTFHLITKDEDGKFRSRTYVFDTARVHLTGTEDYAPYGLVHPASAKALDTAKLEEKKPTVRSWFAHTWQALQMRFHGTASKP